MSRPGERRRFFQDDDGRYKFWSTSNETKHIPVNGYIIIIIIHWLSDYLWRAEYAREFVSYSQLFNFCRCFRWKES